MAPGVKVRDGVRCAHASVGVVHSWADHREGGGEVVEGPCKCGAHMSNGNADEFHPLPVFLEGRDEGVVPLGISCLFLVASEVSGEPDFSENDGAQFVYQSWWFRGMGCPGLLWCT
jgi:hypothetical protein